MGPIAITCNKCNKVFDLIECAFNIHVIQSEFVMLAVNYFALNVLTIDISLPFLPLHRALAAPAVHGVYIE